MPLKKNIKLGKARISILNFLICLFTFININSSSSEESIRKTTDLKILDKISSKNELVSLINGEEFIYKDLSIKSMKCTN